MRHPVATTVCTLAAAAAGAATVVPPRNLGELASRADAVVLARAGASQVTRRGPLLFTVTRFEPLEVVAAGTPLRGAFEVQAPGGVVGDTGWFVAGSPRFAAGEVYLLFLSARPGGAWAPTLLSYGLLVRKAGLWGRSLLLPVAEHGALEAVVRPDGVVVEVPGPYREAELLAHLRAVAAGRARWSARAVLALPQEVPVSVQAIPSGCVYLTSPPLRWPYNTARPPGTVQIWGEATGDLSRPGGGFAEVEGAVGDWSAVPGTGLSLAYAGKKAYTLTCTGGTDFPADTEIVIFNDPCDDLPDLVGCSGISPSGDRTRAARTPSTGRRGGRSTTGRSWSTTAFRSRASARRTTRSCSPTRWATGWGSGTSPTPRRSCTKRAATR